MKKKLKLNDLKVQSFVTNLNPEQSVQAVGGAVAVTHAGACNTLLISCISGCVSCPECIPPYQN